MLQYCLFVFVCISFTNACDNSTESLQDETTVTSSTFEMSTDTYTFHNSPVKKLDKSFLCYYGSWAAYRTNNGSFKIDNIDPFLCSHIIYAFTGLSWENKIRSLESYNSNSTNNSFIKFTSLKKVNPKLKTLVAVGGWNEGSIKYSTMAANSTARNTFIQSCLQFLEKYNFDGLQLDWEYPGSRGGKPEDKENFAILLKELKQAFQFKGYILSATVSSNKAIIDRGYNIPKISEYLDLINVKTYDYHGGWDKKTGHNAPLYERPNERMKDKLANVNYSINYWLNKGAPKNKLILGMATFGRSFTLENAKNNSLGAPVSQRGKPGPYTKEEGSLGYNEICELQKKENWTIVRDPYHLSPFMFRGNQWVGYDDGESITLKARYIKYIDIAGGMVWSLETDDFLGICDGKKNNLINAVKKELQSPNNTLPLPVSLIKTNNSQTPFPSTPPTSWTIWTLSTTPITVSSSTTQKTSTSSSFTNSTLTTSKTSSTSDVSTLSTIPSTSSGSTNSPTRSTASSTSLNPSIITSSSVKTSKTPLPSKKTTWTLTTPITTSAPKITVSSTFSTISHITSTVMSSTRKPSMPLPDTISTNVGLKCKYQGTFRHPVHCHRFYSCVRTREDGKYNIFQYTCPPNTVFDNNSRVCLWPHAVPECNKKNSAGK